VIYQLLDPEHPGLAQDRARIFAAIRASKQQKCEFKYEGRWYVVKVFPARGLVFRYRSNAESVSPELESELICFLRSADV